MLSGVLAGVTYQTAVLRPSPGAHSIWELVLHLSVWMSVPTQRVAGAEIPLCHPIKTGPPRPNPPNPAGTKRSISSPKRDEPWNRKCANSPTIASAKRSWARSPIRSTPRCNGVVQHNLYHAGQIALRKKAAG